MTRHPTSEELGEPALRIDGFQLWVHGYQFPDSTDEWDGNWLWVTAHCGAAGAAVWVSGALLTVPDILHLEEECEALRQGQVQLAELTSLEPELKINIQPVDRLGHLEVKVEITPDHMSQQHSFQFEIDQTYLPLIAMQCRAITQAYPIRGEQKGRGV
jgi:hypothetical protein